MTSFKQNISVLPSKFVIISGVTFPDGNEIPLGVPTSGNFNGLITGWTTSTYVTDAIDELNKIIIDFTKSIKTFNNTSDWIGPINGYYSITYLSSAHNKGIYPNYLIEELISPSFYGVIPDSVITSDLGDITFYVTESPDGRFSGRIIVV
jgi:hypothetical protein